MNVGFDISQTAHIGGVSNYTENLAEQLLKFQDLEMIFFYSSMRKPYKGDLKSVKSFKLPPTFFEFLFNRLRNVPVEKFIGPIDIFHSSDWIQPPTKAKKVTTYHDVVPLKYPKWSHPKIVGVQKRRLKLVEEEINCVIVVSESTKKDLMSISNIPEDRIVVIYEGVANHFRILDRDAIEKFREERGLPENFVLAIAGIGERRNLGKVRRACQNYNLVVLGEDVVNLKKEELPYLYNCAETLLYPSFYEGFGLPVLEAMACGVPVITSNVSSLPEVGGDAALYVDPNDQTDIDNKLKRVMEDDGLRIEVIKKGLVQSRKFSWEKCARETYEVYKNLIRV